MNNSRRNLALAGLLMALGVMLGAFGAHALKTVLTPQRLESYGLAVSYQIYNSLGLMVIALVQQRQDSALLRWAVRLVLAGMLFFCGSIYALCAGMPSWFGMVAPLGGTAFMAAWLCFAIAVWRQRTV